MNKLPLTQSDFDKLAASFISKEMVQAAKLFRVDSREGANLVGRNGNNDYAGIVFPYFLPEQTSPREYRLRRDNPELEQKLDGAIKEKNKYLSPPGRGNLIYFVPGTLKVWLQDTSLPVCVTEGEKKTLALWALSLHGLSDDVATPRFLSIGLGGVWNWRGVVGKTQNQNGKRVDIKGAIPDLNLINWQGRVVFIIYDANVATNESVRAARRGLAEELKQRGAIVRFVDLPEIEGVNGIDDLLGSKGPDFVLDLIEKAQAFEAIDWSEPVALPDDLLPVPKLTPDLLPHALRDWLVDISERMQCPLEFPTVAAIVLIASIIGNRIRIQPKRVDDWTVTPNLWGGVVGRPGVLKSPALEETLKTAKAREKIARDEHAEAMRDFEFNKMRANAERKQLEKDIALAVKNGQDASLLRNRLRDTEAKEPTERRYVVNDPTVEKLGELLNQNPRGLLLFRDELVGWFKSLEKDGHEQDRTFYLETWKGYGSYTYDRISRGTLRIDNLTLCILGSIQPGPLRQYLYSALNGGSGDDGLVQRFQLLVYPDPLTSWKNVDREPNKQAASIAHECFAKLDALETEDIGAQLAVTEDGASFGYLRFDDEAQAFFDSWHEDLENSLRDGSFEHPALEAHLSKYRSLMPSLALLFHLLDIVSGYANGNVSLESARRAAAWCSFLEKHARRIYGIALTTEIKQAKAILEKIKRGQLEPTFTARDIYRKGWAGFSKSSDVTEPLQILVDYGWLQAINAGPTDKGGRSSITYIAHPSLIDNDVESEVTV
jgi:putative DNA primase/helicase